MLANLTGASEPDVFVLTSNLWSASLPITQMCTLVAALFSQTPSSQDSASLVSWAELTRYGVCVPCSNAFLRRRSLRRDVAAVCTGLPELYRHLGCLACMQHLQRI